jgi:Protein of unknown function (DUF3987)
MTVLVIDRDKAVEAARIVLALSRQSRQPPDYPVAALGPLEAACTAIASAGQVQPALVGQCLLDAASLLSQGLFNAQTLTGNKPLSIYLLTLGDSGDGKSTAQVAALSPVNEWQREQARKYSIELKEFERAKGNRKKGDGPREQPPCPFRLLGDATVEGLRRDGDTGVCAQGIFTDEAAAILSGYGMSADHRSKTAGVFLQTLGCWALVGFACGGRPRRTLGRPRRAAFADSADGGFGVHWRPRAFRAGFLAALLGGLARAPSTTPGPALQPGQLPALQAYWQRCNALLPMPLPDDAGDCPALPLADDARVLLGRAFEDFEVEARQGGLRAVKPFALRASEQACRVAGVLAAFAGEDIVSVGPMRGALALVAYSLKTWQAFIEEGAIDHRGVDALRLYAYLTDRPGWSEALAVIVNSGPACLRTKDKRDAALAMLEAAGLVSVLDRTAVALTPPSSTG